MININHAILHIMDSTSCITVLSEEELPIDNSISADYIKKHVTRCLNDIELKTGIFNSESTFIQPLNDYLQTNTSFIDFTRSLANTIFDYYAASNADTSCDLIMVDATIDEINYFIVLKCLNKLGFIHQINQETEKVQTDITHHYAILPSPSQRIQECFLINLSDNSIKVKEKAKIINGEEQNIFTELILDCSTNLSTKEAVTIVNEVTEMVAQNNHMDTVEVLTKAKNYTLENLESSDYLDPVKLGKNIFQGEPSIQKEFEEEITAIGAAEPVKVEKSYIIRNRSNHKIKTDTGIEISFPVEYYNDEYINFNYNPDGTISIELKNIGSIINK